VRQDAVRDDEGRVGVDDTKTSGGNALPNSELPHSSQKPGLNGLSASVQCWLSYLRTGKSNFDDEKTVLKELVPMLACRNSSGAGMSGFWSSEARYNLSL